MVLTGHVRSAAEMGVIMTGRGPTSARILKLWLDIVFYLGALFACFMALWLLLSPLIMSSPDSHSDVSIPVALGAGSVIPVLTLQQAETTTSEIANPRVLEGRGQLRFETNNWGLQFLPNLVTLFGISVVLLLVYLLRTVLKSVIERTNARRVRTIGFILLGIGFLVPAVEYFLARTVLARITVEGVMLSPPFDVREDTVVAGLLLIVLATIFGYGTQLEADKSLTI